MAASQEVGVHDPSASEQPGVRQEKRCKKTKLKLFDNLFKDIPSETSDESKLQIVCQRYQDVLQSQKETAVKLKQYEQRIQSIKHERDQLQTERNRLVLQKDKLETLCREMQKQNKLIQDENLARTRAEDEKRREVSEHFQTAITTIQLQLNEYQTRNMELRNENQDLESKLNKFIQQHEKREEHIEKLIRARDLEAKLSEAKLNKSQCLLDQERIKSQQLVTQLKEEARLLQERLDMHITLESKLKEQIEFYKTKYQKFNKTISQSNKLFDSAKSEMELLAKRVRQSEGDVTEWRGKWEQSQRTLLEVVADQKKQVEETIAAKKQADRMSSLCRALQGQLREMRQSVGDLKSTNESESKFPDGQGDGPSATTSQPSAIKAPLIDSNISTTTQQGSSEALKKKNSVEQSLVEGFEDVAYPKDVPSVKRATDSPPLETCIAVASEPSCSSEDPA